jgi:hypothetical protein
MAHKGSSGWILWKRQWIIEFHKINIFLSDKQNFQVKLYTWSESILRLRELTRERDIFNRLNRTIYHNLCSISTKLLLKTEGGR